MLPSGRPRCGESDLVELTAFFQHFDRDLHVGVAAASDRLGDDIMGSQAKLHDDVGDTFRIEGPEGAVFDALPDDLDQQG